jgi:hypothetical protein
MVTTAVIVGMDPRISISTNSIIHARGCNFVLGPDKYNTFVFLLTSKSNNRNNAPTVSQISLCYVRM